MVGDRAPKLGEGAREMSGFQRPKWLEPFVVPNEAGTAWTVPEPALKALATLAAIHETQRLIYARINRGDPLGRALLDQFTGRVG